MTLSIMLDFFSYISSQVITKKENTRGSNRIFYERFIKGLKKNSKPGFLVQACGLSFLETEMWDSFEP